MVVVVVVVVTVRTILFRQEMHNNTAVEHRIHEEGVFEIKD